MFKCCSKTNSSNKKSPFFLITTIGVIFLLSLSLLFLLKKSQFKEDVGLVTKPLTTSINKTTSSAYASVKKDSIPPIIPEDHRRGNKDAKIALIEYSDFECSFCWKLEEEVIKKLLIDYPNDVQVIFRHFPLTDIHPNAQKAAEASECAGEQGKFFEMQEAIFKANKNKNFSTEQWSVEAKNLNLNTEQFDKCLNDGKYFDKVNIQKLNASAAGVSEVPVTFINGKMVKGVQSYDNFKAIIEGFLK